MLRNIPHGYSTNAYPHLPKALAVFAFTMLIPPLSMGMGMGLGFGGGSEDPAIKSQELVVIDNIGGLKGPARINVSSAGNIFVADHVRGEVVVFDANGRKIRTLKDSEAPLGLAISEANLSEVQAAEPVAEASPQYVCLETETIEVVQKEAVETMVETVVAAAPKAKKVVKVKQKLEKVVKAIPLPPTTEASGKSPLQTSTIRINNAGAADIATFLQAKDNRFLSERGTVTVKGNTLVVEDAANVVAAIRKLVKELDSADLDIANMDIVEVETGNGDNPVQRFLVKTRIDDDDVGLTREAIEGQVTEVQTETQTTPATVVTQEVCKQWGYQTPAQAAAPVQLTPLPVIYVGDEADGSVKVIDNDSVSLLGNGSGEFGKPNGIAVTTGQTVYVVDSTQQQVKVYDNLGDLQFTFGAKGPGNGQFDFPGDIVLNEARNELYVSDFWNKRIVVFDLAGTWKRNIYPPLNDRGDPAFFRPAGLGIGPEGNLYVVDHGLSCVVILTHQGGLVDIIGYSGGQYWTGDLALPLDVAADGQKIYVTSSQDGIVKVFEEVTP